MQQQMTYQEVLQGLFDALTDLKTAVTKYGYTPRSGICLEVDKYWEARFGDSTFEEVLSCLGEEAPADLLADLMEQWPEGTGCRAYPVPAIRGCVDKDSAFRAYVSFKSFDMRWVGEQLELRLELIDYLLNELSDRLEKTNASK